MKEDIHSEEELRSIEQEIRSLGIPYTSDEPDERYFANFRVHLMERIEENQKKQGFFSTAWAWLLSSPMHYLSVGGSLAGIIVAVTLLQPVQQTDVATVEPVRSNSAVSPVAPVLPATPEVSKPVASIPKTSRREHEASKVEIIAQAPKPNAVSIDADAAADFAALDASLSGSGADSDDPVNLEKLSVSELESVIAMAQEMK